MLTLPVAAVWRDSKTFLRTKIQSTVLRKLAFALVLGLLVEISAVQSAGAELTKEQAIARVRAILNNNARACKLKIRSVSAIRVKAGWRVTAQITIAASGTPYAETAAWIVSRRNGASAQNQLTAEIANGCP